MSPAEIHRFVCEAFDDFVVKAPSSQKWDILRDNLVGWASGLDVRVAFDGLLSVLESEGRFQYQDIAGEILARADIPCPLALPEFMGRVFALWNPSAGTVPRYAVQVFGRESVLEFIQSQPVGLQPSRIEAIRYWLGEDSANG